MAQLVSPYSSSFGQFHPKQSTRLRQRTIPCFFIMCLTARTEFDNLHVGYDSAPRKGCFSLPAICICYDSNSYTYTTTPHDNYKYFMLCALDFGYALCYIYKVIKGERMSNHSNDLLLDRVYDIMEDTAGLPTDDVQALIVAVQDGDLDEVSFLCSKLEAMQAVEHFGAESE